MARYRILLWGIVSLAVVALGLWYVWRGEPGWYSLFVLGGTFTLAWLNYLLSNPGLISDTAVRPKAVVYSYLGGVGTAIVLEAIGRHTLGLWSYPELAGISGVVQIYLITYPFALFMIYETYVLIRQVLPRVPTFLITWFLSAFIHELPNVRVGEWVYDIPVTDLTIGGINIVVILGWSILIAAALCVRWVHLRES